MLLLMWRKDKYYVLHGMTLNWWFTLESRLRPVHHGALQEQGRLHLPLDTRLIQPQEKSAICDKQYVEEVRWFILAGRN